MQSFEDLQERLKESIKQGFAEAERKLKRSQKAKKQREDEEIARALLR